MSAKLDQALDEIVATNRRTNTNKTRRGGKVRAATTAPVGGVRKASQQQKPPKTIPSGPSAGVKLGGESKIQISGLVSTQKEYIPCFELTQSSPKTWTSAN
jgi:hypothetical protein